MKTEIVLSRGRRHSRLNLPRSLRWGMTGNILCLWSANPPYLQDWAKEWALRLRESRILTPSGRGGEFTPALCMYSEENILCNVHYVGETKRQKYSFIFSQVSFISIIRSGSSYRNKKPPTLPLVPSRNPYMMFGGTKAMLICLCSHQAIYY